MKSMLKIISLFLTLVTVLGSFASVMTLGVSAAEEETEVVVDETEEIDPASINYLTHHFNTPEERLAVMTPKIASGDTVLYVNEYTGEVALQNKKTGEILFSNPYDVADSVGSDSTKYQVMSQIAVQYTDNGTTKYMYSFEDATLRDQVLVKNIKNGIRVEYVIGREETRKLVPRMISAVNFKTMILDKVLAAFDNDESNWYYKRFKSFFSLKSLATTTTEAQKRQMLSDYPICEEFDIYVFVNDASTAEMNFVEDYIKTYCPEYTFEQMEKDHAECGYNESSVETPVFKMALEYTLEDGDLTVRLPANGIRYNSTLYTLESISVLPYFGAGSSANDGYIFMPDGSGALFEFESPESKASTTIRGKVYGTDYAYHTISGKYQQQITAPVFGLVEEQEFYTYSYEDGENDITYDNLKVARSVMTRKQILAQFEGDTELTLTSDIESESRTTGFFAIIEQGESLCEIEVYRAGVLSDYNAVRAYFNPRPKDTYSLSDSISVTSTDSWTVVSDRKYTEDLVIRYVMLSDPDLAEKNGVTGSYEPTYLGMAQAYRDYLIENDVLTRLTADDVEEDIPLYIEAFGAIEATEQILSVPVTVKKALTTFDDIRQMYDDLSAAGMNNINFRLTGFANGGLYYNVPSALNWESSVGGKNGFKELVAYAEEIAKNGGNLGIYPDFDFVFVKNDALFDATNLKDHAIRTIDSRYAMKRYYSATQQAYESYFQNVISPSAYSHFYEKLLANYDKYGVKTMSVSTLGSSLNTDFDKNDPYNREDNKKYTEDAFAYFKEQGYTVMTDVGNSYVWKYADHILNITLDSSRYTKASNSVPFLGIVLHGYVQFAGTAMNMEGNMNFAKLKAIESGAGAYFTLSYSNTDLLKEDKFYSQYYSVRYDIWKDDLIDVYTEMNAALSDVQDKEIINHDLLSGLRVLDEDEIEEQLDALIADTAKTEANAARDAQVAAIKSVADALEYARSAVAEVSTLYSYTVGQFTKGGVDSLESQYNTLLELKDKVIKAKAEYDAAQAYSGITPTELNTAKNAYNSSLTTFKRAAVRYITFYNTVIETGKTFETVTEAIAKAKKIVNDTEGLPTVLVDEINKNAKTVEDTIAQFSVASEYVGTTFEGTGFIALANDAYAKMLTLVGDFTTEEELLSYIHVITEKTEEEAEEEEVYNPRLSDNGNIVAVTYGERTVTEFGTILDPYKVFILNYNNYDVKVEYEGITYFIAANDYVIIMK